MDFKENVQFILNNSPSEIDIRLKLDKMDMDKSQRTIIKFILGNSISEIDMRWKLGKYIKDNDLSFLGKKITILKDELQKVNKISAKISK